jgi:hypothetical protein
MRLESEGQRQESPFEGLRSPPEERGSRRMPIPTLRRENRGWKWRVGVYSGVTLLLLACLPFTFSLGMASTWFLWLILLTSLMHVWR